MSALAQFYAAHGFWTWIAAGVLLLAVEVASGTGYLLWPAASAAVVAVAHLVGVRIGLAGEIGVFAFLTILTTLLSKKFFRPGPVSEPDINDIRRRLMGHHGYVSGSFASGRGRVFVDGKEWAALAGEGEVLADQDPVVVTGMADGASLVVRRG